MPRRRSAQFVLLFGVLTLLAYFKMEWNAEKRLMHLSPRNTSFKTPNSHTWADNFNLSYQGQPKVKVIIILAYMHTGSTFLGSILQQIPGAYYEYETLRSLQYDSRNRVTVVYMNGSERHSKGKYIDVTMAADAVSKLITCDHRQLDISTLSRYYFDIKSAVMRDTGDYYRCLRVRQWHERPTGLSSSTGHSHLSFNRFLNPTSLINPNKQKEIPLPRMHALQRQRRPPSKHLLHKIQKCLPLLTENCENATTRLFKFIRLSMEVAGRLLPKFSDIKIIHLTRDPRAMLDSQVRKNDNGAKHFDSFVENTIDMCTRLKRDLDRLYILRKSYPESFYSIQYERFAQSPIKESEKLMNFLGFKLSKTIKSYVESKTILAEKNSSERAAVWRHHISLQHLNALDLNCDKVYTELGYIKYPSILDIRNFSKPTFLAAKEKDSIHTGPQK